MSDDATPAASAAPSFSALIRFRLLALVEIHTGSVGECSRRMGRSANWLTASLAEPMAARRSTLRAEDVDDVLRELRMDAEVLFAPVLGPVDVYLLARLHTRLHRPERTRDGIHAHLSAHYLPPEAGSAAVHRYRPRVERAVEDALTRLEAQGFVSVDGDGRYRLTPGAEAWIPDEAPTLPDAETLPRQRGPGRPPGPPKAPRATTVKDRTGIVAPDDTNGVAIIAPSR